MKRLTGLLAFVSLTSWATVVPNQSDQLYCMFDNKQYPLGAVIRAQDGFYTCKLVSISNARNEAPVWVKIGKRLDPSVSF
ncbi:DUF1496 domain-containing protein [Burkholderiaceae bacterium DAT-1]|nr:DUF1496 domain-containing protein [Burkholderiaceae bacterium DAT-1]